MPRPEQRPDLPEGPGPGPVRRHRPASLDGPPIRPPHNPPMHGTVPMVPGSTRSGRVRPILARRAGFGDDRAPRTPDPPPGAHRDAQADRRPSDRHHPVLPAGRDPGALEVRARGHDPGHLRQGPAGRGRRPRADRRGLGRDPPERPMGLAQLTSPTRSGTRPFEALTLRLAAAWAELRRDRPPDRGRRRLPASGPAPSCSTRPTPAGARVPSRSPGSRPWSPARPSTWPCTTPTGSSTAGRPTRPTTPGS